MIRIGKTQTLELKRSSPHGWYLTDNHNNEVLLPNKFCSEDFDSGIKIDVFIFRDSEQRLTATIQKPKLELYQYALLPIVATSRIGAFADMGLEKHLLIPFKEMHERLQQGENVMIYMFLDSVTERLVGSARVTKWLEKEDIHLKRGEKVHFQYFESHNLGYKVIINQRYQGILYKKEVAQPLQLGNEGYAFVENIRPDGLIDLKPLGLGREKLSDTCNIILNYLSENDNFMEYNDKSSADSIREVFNMSKRTFKETLGDLYKKRLITIRERGVYRNNPNNHSG